MKIGIDCRLWNELGVGRYIRNLVGQLVKIDRKNTYVLFVLSKNVKEILNQVQNDNFRIVNADIRWHTVGEQLKFPSIINKENLDLTHFPYFSVPIFYNKPFIVTIHDLILHHFPTGKASTLPLLFYKLKLLGYKFVISQAAKRAEKIIAVSNATKSEIVDHLGVDKDKVVVTYEGSSLNSKLKTASFSKASAAKQNSKISRGARSSSARQLKAQNYFLYVGNAYPHKNLERLIEAFSIICHPELVSGSQSRRDSDFRQNDAKLVLVGREDYFYKRLKKKVKKMGLEKSVVFLGEVSDEELTSLYRNAIALVMPSFMEGFGLPALEAMANKCLVLASDIPSIREICDNAAIYFNPYGIDNIKKTMEYVCFNDLNHFSKKIESGFEKANMLSWQKMAKETLKTYESCVGVRSGQ